MLHENYYCRLGFNYEGVLMLPTKCLESCLKHGGFAMASRDLPGPAYEDGLYLAFFICRSRLAVEATVQIVSVDNDIVMLDVINQEDIEMQDSEIKEMQ